MMRPREGLKPFKLRMFEDLDDEAIDDAADGLEEQILLPEFIPLDGGRKFIRQTEIIGLAWIGPRKHAVLGVYFTDAPRSDFAGDDARAIMRAFGLPEECP